MSSYGLKKSNSKFQNVIGEFSTTKVWVKKRSHSKIGHYQKIPSFFPILMKLGKNFMRIGQNLWIFNQWQTFERVQIFFTQTLYAKLWNSIGFTTPPRILINETNLFPFETCRVITIEDILMHSISLAECNKKVFWMGFSNVGLKSIASKQVGI